MKLQQLSRMKIHRAASAACLLWAFVAGLLLREAAGAETTTPTPVVSPSSVDAGRKVRIGVFNNERVRVTVYRYTLDGTTPTVDSPVLDRNVPPVVGTNATVVVRAWNPNYTNPSVPVTNQVRRLEPPTINQGGAYVTITAPTNGVVKYVRHYPNLLHPENWVPGTTGSQPGFSRNGDVEENAIALAEGPYGNTITNWVAMNKDADLGPDGGFETAQFPINKARTYRYSVWLKKTGATAGGTYFGPRNVSNLTGPETLLSNPYFYIEVIPTNQWTKIYGYIWPAGSANTTSYSRAFTADSTFVGYGTDFKWLSTSTLGGDRVYLYYQKGLSEQLQIFDPRVEESDGDVYTAQDVYLTSPWGVSTQVESKGLHGPIITALSYGANPLFLASLPVEYVVSTNLPNPTIIPVALENGRRVRLTTPFSEPGTQLRYTTDGTEPTASAGFVFNNAASIETTGSGTYIFKLFHDGYVPSGSVTQVVQKLTPPAFSQSGVAVTLAAPSGAQVKYLRRYPNLLPVQNWAPGSSGSQPGFSRNGEISENSIELGQTPYATTGTNWVGNNQDAAQDADGGWEAVKFAVDKTKTYRYSVWLRRSGILFGSTYFGPRDVSALNASGEASLGNPYFWFGNTLPADQWELAVGYVRPAGHAGTTSAGKIYDALGQPIIDMTDFKWMSTTTQGGARGYLYYAPFMPETLRFWNPRVEIVDNVTDPADVYWAAAGGSTILVDTGIPGGMQLDAVSSHSNPLFLASDVAYYSVSAVPPTTAPVVTGAALENGRKSRFTATAADGAQIRYTTDGTQPTASTGLLYNSATPPETTSAVTYIFRAFLSGYSPSGSVTQAVTKLAAPAISQSGNVVTMAAPSGAAVKHLRRYPNLLPTQNWIPGTSGSQTGFFRNGDAIENLIELSASGSPYRTTATNWVAANQDADSGADGGWEAARFAVDKTKTYRYSMWLKKSGALNGIAYFGARDVSNLNGVATDSLNTNPYFWQGNFSALPLNEWELVVSYVRPAGHTGTTSAGKVYSVIGQELFNATDFKWLAGTTNGGARAYLYYSVNLAEQLRFWNPRVERVDDLDGAVDVYWAAAGSESVPVDVSVTGGLSFEAISYGATALQLASAPAYFTAAPPSAPSMLLSSQGSGGAAGSQVAASSQALRTSFDGKSIVVQWDGKSGQLEEADATTGPWRVVEGAGASPFKFVPTGTARFFRLQVP